MLKRKCEGLLVRHGPWAPCETRSLRRRNLLLLPFLVESEAAIAIHLHDHVDHMSIKQHSQQLAGEVAVPHGVVSCCEVDKHSFSLLLSREDILDVLCQLVGLVYGRHLVSKSRLLLWE